jgi:hypothetical protein
MEMFVRMNSLLQRNAQQICPRSPFELYRRGTRKLTAIQEVETERTIARLMAAYGKLQPDSIEPQWVGGTGLYFLHSCLNHSCEPNADVVFLHENNRLSVVATVDIPVRRVLLVSVLTLAH